MGKLCAVFVLCRMWNLFVCVIVRAAVRAVVRAVVQHSVTVRYCGKPEPIGQQQPHHHLFVDVHGNIVGETRLASGSHRQSKRETEGHGSISDPFVSIIFCNMFIVCLLNCHYSMAEIYLI